MLNNNDILEFLTSLPVMLQSATKHESNVVHLFAPKRFLIGYSGGLDSTVLLHVMHFLLPRLKQQYGVNMGIDAIHINHNLSANARLWQDHCQAVCTSLHIPLVVESVHVNSTGKGIEAAARHARYGAFEKHMDDKTVLLTAHHADDQAETLLFRLMRGSGLQGMSGIQPYRSFAGGCIARPLLTVPRDVLEQYAHEHNLSWIDDESNEDEQFSRNYIRRTILPLLTQRWPKAVTQLGGSAQRAAESQLLLTTYLQQDFIVCDRRDERVGESISLAKLQSFATNKKTHILRYWFDLLGCRLPSSAVMEHVNTLMDTAADSASEIKIDQYVLRKFNHRLFLLPDSFFQSLAQANVHDVYDVYVNKKHVLPGDFLFSVSSQEENTELPIAVRFRQGGERSHPAGRRHSQTLKKLLQEYKIEPWLRNIVPLVYCDNKLMAVGDLWVETDAVFSPQALTWQYGVN